MKKNIHEIVAEKLVDELIRVYGLEYVKNIDLKNELAESKVKTIISEKYKKILREVLIDYYLLYRNT